MMMENASEAIKFTSVWRILSRTRAKVAPLQMVGWNGMGWVGLWKKGLFEVRTEIGERPEDDNHAAISCLAECQT